MMEEARAYEELRVGFTAAVSHELRTPLARLLALLDNAALPGSDRNDLLAQARQQVEEMSELVDDILFLSELESGREVVALGSTPALPVLEEVRDRLADSAERADVEVVLDTPANVQLPLRRRMLHVVTENIAENAIRYAGPGATLTLRVRPGLLEAADDGRGLEEEELPRLFERFYRSDRARASRGTGLGLAIVKHVVVSAGGKVEALGGPGRGLRIRCTFPAP
jgi:two-component system phosphate regulon sensor histidine kinase PhoR